MKIILILLTLLTLSYNITAAELVPFIANYETNIKHGINATGHAVISLQHREDTNWVLNFKADALLMSVSQESVFAFKNDEIYPYIYKYKRAPIGNKKSYRFNHSSKTAKFIDKDNATEVDIVDGTLDQASYLVALQADLLNGKSNMQYHILDGKKLEKQQFKVIKEEIIQTPLGTFLSVKVSRIRNNNSKRQTYAWFAKDYNYLLVRLQQTEPDGKSMTINITSASISGENVLGQ